MTSIEKLNKLKLVVEKVDKISTSDLIDHLDDMKLIKPLNSDGTIVGLPGYKAGTNWCMSDGLTSSTVVDFPAGSFSIPIFINATWVVQCICNDDGPADLFIFINPEIFSKREENKDTIKMVANALSVILKKLLIQYEDSGIL